MNEITYAELVNRLRTIAKAHYNVGTSQAGVLESLNYGEITYPLVFFVSDTVEFTVNETRYNMIMLVADICDEHLLQQTTIQSAMLEITKNILSYLINGNANSDWIFDENSVRVQPFVDNLPDLTAGWQTNFTIRCPFNNTGCDLPIDTSQITFP
jgi:hypothetical protein